MACIIMVGSPTDGFRYFGPFETGEDAVDWGEQSHHLLYAHEATSHNEWWVVPLEPLDSPV